MENDIEKFLCETKFCNFNNPEVKKLAKEITKNYSNEKDKAVALFYWVRDNILYRVGLWKKTASETLKEKEGTCTNKANLLVALLRANDIPAGYGVMKVYGRYFGPIAIPMLRKFIGNISVHTYVFVYLNNEWIKCDPSVDKILGGNISYVDKENKIVEWDGIKDAVLNFKKIDIINDSFPLANIDECFTKKPRHARGFPLKIANIYIKFVRKNTEKITNALELENLFKKWLKVNHPFYFYFFFIISWLKYFKTKFKKDGKNS